MELDKGMLKIYYNEGELNQKLDQALCEVLEKFRYSKCASGMGREWDRDMEFVHLDMYVNKPEQE